MEVTFVSLYKLSETNFVIKLSAEHTNVACFLFMMEFRKITVRYKPRRLLTTSIVRCRTFTRRSIQGGFEWRRCVTAQSF